MKCPGCGNNITLIEFSCARCGLKLPVHNQEERIRAEKMAEELSRQMALEARMNLALAHRKDRVVMDEDVRMATRIVTPEDKALSSAATVSAASAKTDFSESELASLREAVGESKLLRSAKHMEKPTETQAPKRPSLIKATPENNPFAGIDLMTGETLREMTPAAPYADIDASFEEEIEDAPQIVVAPATAAPEANDDALPGGSALAQLKAMARAAEARFNAEQDAAERAAHEADKEAEHPKATTLLPDEPIPPDQWKGDPRKIMRSSRYIQPERPVNVLQALPTKFRKLPVKKEDKEPIRIDVRRLLAVTAVTLIVAVIIGVIGVSLMGSSDNATEASAAAETTIDAGFTAAPDTPSETESVTAP